MKPCQHPDCPKRARINDTWCLDHCPDGTPVTLWRQHEELGDLLAEAGYAPAYRNSQPPESRPLTDAEKAFIAQSLQSRYEIF